MSLRCLLGIHDWVEFPAVFVSKRRRKCVRCGAKEKHRWHDDSGGAE